MTIRNKTTNLYTEWLPLIENLSNEEAGILIKNILKYQNGEEIDCNNPIWIFIKSKIDDYNNNLFEIRKSRIEAGKLGGLAKASKCQQELANDGKLSNKTKQNKIKENKTKVNDNEKFIDYEFVKNEYEKCSDIFSFDLDKFWNYWKDKGLLKKDLSNKMISWNINFEKKKDKSVTNQKIIY